MDMRNLIDVIKLESGVLDCFLTAIKDHRQVSSTLSLEPTYPYHALDCIMMPADSLNESISI
jgi:hypothetical protein